MIPAKWEVGAAWRRLLAGTPPAYPSRPLRHLRTTRRAANVKVELIPSLVEWGLTLGSGSDRGVILSSGFEPEEDGMAAPVYRCGQTSMPRPCAPWRSVRASRIRPAACWRWQRSMTGSPRTEAARLGGVGLQIVRDWVLRFNAEGPDGLMTGKAPGPARG